MDGRSFTATVISHATWTGVWNRVRRGIVVARHPVPPSRGRPSAKATVRTSGRVAGFVWVGCYQE